MKSHLDPALGVLLLAAMALSTAVAGESPDPRSRLEKRVFKNAQGETLPYRLLVPKDLDPNRKYPLLVFFHGAGERGTDNEAQLKHAQALSLVTGEAGKKHPAFFIAPQCPEGAQWCDTPWSFPTPHRTPAQPSKPMRLTMEALDALAKEFALDPARLYVTGLSMGGFGTFDFCARRPDAVVAAIPVCGGADDAKAAAMAGIAFWVFHGGSDGVVPTVRSRSAMAALKKAGAEVKYTEYAGMGHDSWTKAYYEPGLAEWLFSKRRDVK